MTWTRWSPCPPQFVYRRAVQGVKPTGDRATTIFDLRPDRKHVAVYPATIATFAMLIDRSGVDLLVAAIESGKACAVPGTHAIHGHRPFGLRPCDGPFAQPPLELYVHLPDAQIHIRYGRDQLAVLHDALIQITALMH